MVEQNYNKIVNSLLRTLPDRGREVLERRYGIVGDPETLEAIGEDFSVTRERVRQIEEAAFAQLRKAEEMKELEDIFSYLYRHINDYGEHRREERLLNDFPGQKNSPAIIFLLDLGNDFKRRNETEKHYTLWTVNPTRLAHLEGFIGAVEQRLEEISKPLNNVNFWKEVDKISRKTKLSLSKKATESWLSQNLSSRTVLMNGVLALGRKFYQKVSATKRI